MAPYNNSNSRLSSSFVGYITLRGKGSGIKKRYTRNSDKAAKHIVKVKEAELNPVTVARANKQNLYDKIHNLTNCSGQEYRIKQNAIQSPLLRLPAHIRDKIWDYIFNDIFIPTPPFEDRIKTFSEWFDSPDSFKVALTIFGISRVSKQIHQEVALRAYTTSTFIFGEISEFQWFRWEEQFTSEQLNAITSVAPCLKILYGYFERRTYVGIPLREVLPNLKRITVALPGEAVVSYYDWLSWDRYGDITRQGWQARMTKRIQNIEGADVEVVFDSRPLETDDSGAEDEVGSAVSDDEEEEDRSSDDGSGMETEDDGDDESGAEDEGYVERLRGLFNRNKAGATVLSTHFDSDVESGDDCDEEKFEMGEDGSEEEMLDLGQD